MKILITGATGLIGRNFVQRFDQYQYVVLTRNANAARKTLGPKPLLIQNLNELSDLNTFSAVLNLAGEPIVGKRWSAKQKQKITESRILTTQRLVHLIQQSSYPPRTFISGSAVGIYGVNCIAGCHEQSSPEATDFAAQLCVNWEQTAQQVAKITRVVTLRTAIVLSTQGGALQKMLPAFRLNMGGPLSDGRQLMSWIHIEDMCNAIHFILQNEDIAGPVNMAAPSPVTNLEFTKTLASVLQKTAIFPVPSLALKLLLGEAASLLLGSQNVTPHVLQKANFKYKHAHLNKALSHLISQKE
jgi:uncharacterized protein (TIGR01777 family)